ncbi:hypothetical protein F9288_07635 [Sphingomonas sp. CL5.1]|uniref:hypothetical protein n=1 Tax=Sphingomonas sp. CL5.1 TaxID=2653203 RepID=UPI0015829F0E|nr:hypothetical protein [Sphingomonas sp. CL5.1]QKR99530.1 hypothetical protein F9288_07635 [Sphingomonas sp. CL5.1]
MDDFPYVADRTALNDAQVLILTFGRAAADEAVARADRSRDLGNHIHFCRWRQIERLVEWLSAGRADGTIH